MTIHAIRRFVMAIALAAVLILWDFRANSPSSAFAQPADKGEWSATFDTQNVMIHASVLPNGKVLFWSRREAHEGLNPPAPRNCTPRIWDPAMGTGAGAFSVTANKPGFNLFCSGHSFLADGKLFVAGGHIADGKGEPRATIYDPATNLWTETAPMTGGRWYPTVVTLPDGSVLVSFGSKEDGHQNITQQVWKAGVWRSIVTFDPPPYYPRMHVVPDGRVFMSGPLPLTQFLDTSGAGDWTFLRPDPDINKAVDLSSRLSHFLQEYAPSVLFADGKILFVGGGNGPIKNAEILDFNDPPLRWKTTDDMHFARRQHNATLLPDGTVLVMGGTQGHGGETAGFNDLTPGQPIRSAELWDPDTKHWTLMEKAAVDRCYHSIAVLLPDATVLSAGGGEYSPKNDGKANKPEDTHKNAQIFRPPYLFRGARPDITSAPQEVRYGDTFTVGTSHPDQVGKVNWVRLSSVTHSFNTTQRINFLTFTTAATSLSVKAPTDPKLCPPGHYMLFVLNTNKVPSVARIIRIDH